MKNLLLKIFIALFAFSIGILSQRVLKPRQTLTFKSATEKLKSTKVLNIEIGDAPSVNQANQLNDVESVGFSGWFQVSDFGKMKEVWTILLSKDYENSDNHKAVWSAIVLTNKEDDNFVSILTKTDNNTLSFKTRKTRGIEYRFEGVFFKGKKSGIDGEEVLKGSLRKFVRGRQVAVVNANFAYYKPHCWH